MPNVIVSFRAQESLKREFERAIKQHPDFDTSTEFFEAAMTSFVLQHRRKERIKFPLEFLSDKSSEKAEWL